MPLFIYWIAAHSGATLAVHIALLTVISGCSLMRIPRWSGPWFLNWATFYAAVATLVAVNLSYDGRESINPYVRAENASQGQIADLAAARRRYPQIAPLIRQAAADRRITRGEAYDILNGPAIASARAEEEKAQRQADARTVYDGR